MHTNLGPVSVTVLTFLKKIRPSDVRGVPNETPVAPVAARPGRCGSGTTAPGVLGAAAPPAGPGAGTSAGGARPVRRQGRGSGVAGPMAAPPPVYVYSPEYLALCDSLCKVPKRVSAVAGRGGGAEPRGVGSAAAGPGERLGVRRLGGGCRRLGAAGGRGELGEGAVGVWPVSPVTPAALPGAPPPRGPVRGWAPRRTGSDPANPVGGPARDPLPVQPQVRLPRSPSACPALELLSHLLLRFLGQYGTFVD